MRDFLQGQASSLEGLRPGREGEDFNRKNTLKYFENSNLSLTRRLRKIAILGQPPGEDPGNRSGICPLSSSAFQEEGTSKPYGFMGTTGDGEIYNRKI